MNFVYKGLVLLLCILLLLLICWHHLPSRLRDIKKELFTIFPGNTLRKGSRPCELSTETTNSDINFINEELCQMEPPVPYDIYNGYVNNLTCSMYVN